MWDGVYVCLSVRASLQVTGGWLCLFELARYCRKTCQHQADSASADTISQRDVMARSESSRGAALVSPGSVTLRSTIRPSSRVVTSIG